MQPIDVPVLVNDLRRVLEDMRHATVSEEYPLRVMYTYLTKPDNIESLLDALEKQQ